MLYNRREGENMEMMKNLSIIFLSIFLESLPFLLLGALISSLIETYISNEKMASFIPKNKILGSIVGVFLGFFLPACDCAVIPVSKRLLKKKVPIHVAVSFMLASPIINPVVLLSTYHAFYQTNPEIFWLRIILGIVIALIVGILMGTLFGKKEVIRNSLIEEEECSCHKDIEEGFEDLVDECEHCHSHSKGISSVLKHTAYDFFEVVRYLMFGAFLASLVQVFVPRDALLLFHKNSILSVFVLMIFAYGVSLCSTSDSFVGKTFLSTFHTGGVVAYLLLGPMIDIKNTIVLMGNYKKKFVFTLIFMIFMVVFLCSVLVVGLL